MRNSTGTPALSPVGRIAAPSTRRWPPTARALLAEYLTPMSNQNVPGDEARALFEYFRRVDGSTRGASVAGDDGGADHLCDEDRS